MGLDDFFRKGKEEPLPDIKKPAAEPTPPPEVIHVVQAGESLSKIAKEHYGDAMKWNIIYQANSDKISNPDLIHPGEEFVIPKLKEE